MKKFLLMLFISLNLFAIDSMFVSMSTGTNVVTHRLWSDTLTWDRSADDSLLILEDDTTSFDVWNYDWFGVLGTYGWENTTLYYQIANTEDDFDSLTTWTEIKVVGATSANPDMQEALSLEPSKLIQFMAIATGSTDALLEFQFLVLNRNQR